MTDARPRPSSPATLDVVRFSSHDLDDFRSVLRRFFYSAAMEVPGGAKRFQASAEMIQLGPITVGQFRLAAPLVAAADVDAYHVTLPARGRVLIRHAGREYLAGPSTAAVFGPTGRAVVLRDGPPMEELNIKIERAALEDELSTLLGRSIEGPVDLPPTLDLSDGPRLTWRRIVHLLRDELAHPGSLLLQPLIAEQLRHSLLSGLLLSAPHRYLAELTAPAPAGPPRAIRRALDAIHNDPQQPFSVGDLAAVAQVSVRSLQEGFRRHVGCAPMAYLQRVRLDRARDALRVADYSRVTVAAVAHRWGFAHLGRFASAYRARFGEPPSVTLRAAG
ncbi:AraC family transcriptional regulator [Krasilnikovia sp. MM14-A1259]|uniref:helix-turn-helix transcriptional regulator n=1 Tax=Krasilnikovia sp. MM14-A1259 TaxID=3373539 RepID=UPI0038254AFE